ncbi:carboxymuconolactone decarboxylase family protein [Sphingobacterium kitahiroshimense]|uniref:carboxymuconolactone decarboxylase family protein n=1 Tax=Sphingobacterium kitahiroshimense TaxID=470446 RepID=UPI0032096EBD
MDKNKLLKSVLVSVLLITISMVYAQQSSPANQALSSHQKGLVSIAALTATGNVEQLKIELNKGLEAGLTRNEIKEALVQLYAYTGFPRSLNAIQAFMAVVDERKAKGIDDIDGKEIFVNNIAKDKYEQGRKVLEELTKTTQAKPAPGFGEFAPRIDAFLKEHLFADIFVSEVLTYQQRELVTIAALASMTGVEGQLQAHINMGKNTGISDHQLEQLASLIEMNVSTTQANTVRKLIEIPLVPVIKLIRISEIEIHPEFLEEYKAILKEEASASVAIEPGVIAIFPMYQQEDQTQVRIIEIYADKQAYQSHLKTPHFEHYKTSTLPMVKTLKLVDMTDVDQDAMMRIFKKLK